MLDVIIALIPATLAGWYYFGIRAVLITLISVASCIIFEYISRRIMKRNNTISDLSAVVTGLLLAMNLPVSLPLYMVVIGACFAIVVVKQMFGGLGNNFVNPAIAARIFLPEGHDFLDGKIRFLVQFRFGRCRFFRNASDTYPHIRSSFLMETLYRR